MKLAVRFVVLMLSLGACAVDPDDDVEGLTTQDLAASGTVHACPSSRDGLVQIGCYAWSVWGAGTAIDGCLAQINAHLDGIYASDTCGNCTHGNPCTRKVPHWDRKNFGNASNCHTQGTGMGTARAWCDSQAMTQTFACIENDPVVVDKAPDGATGHE